MYICISLISTIWGFMGDGALKVHVCVSVFCCASEASERKKKKVFSGNLGRSVWTTDPEGEKKNYDHFLRRSWMNALSFNNLAHAWVCVPNHWWKMSPKIDYGGG